MLNVRKPTCLQSSPVIMLAGVAGAGKTWAALEASTLPQVDHTFIIEVGESTADTYGAIPGADFLIVEHDGTLQDIRQKILEVSRASQPGGEYAPAEGKFNMLVVDSMTEVWDLLKDNAQAAMMDRIQRKRRKLNGAEPRPDMDLWNRAGETSDGIMRQLASFPGPVIITARLDEVTAMDATGHPTSGKDFKIQVHKKTPFRVNAILEARAPRTWVVTKVQTVNPDLQVKEGEEKTFPDFTVGKLFDLLGVAPNMPVNPVPETRVDGSLGDDQPKVQNQPRNEVEERRQQYVAKLRPLVEAGNLDELHRLYQWGEEHNDRLLLDVIDEALASLKPMNQGQVQEALDAEIVTAA